MKLKQEYLKWKEKGKLSHNGLCMCLKGTKYYETLNLFVPSEKEEERLMSDENLVYWGCGIKESLPYSTVQYELTPLRENIILFILAMNDEL